MVYLDVSPSRPILQIRPREGNEKMDDYDLLKTFHSDRNLSRDADNRYECVSIASQCSSNGRMNNAVCNYFSRIFGRMYDSLGNLWGRDRSITSLPRLAWQHCAR